MNTGVITDALEDTELATLAPQWLTWYVANATEIYAQIGHIKMPFEEDIKIGTMSTIELAEEVVTNHNETLKHVQRPEFNRRKRR